MPRRVVRNFRDCDSDVIDIPFYPYYCSCCGELLLITEVPLEQCRRRSADDSFVMAQKALQKVNWLRAETKLIKRANGVERQYRYCCPKCRVSVGYVSVPFDQKADYVYLLNGGITSTFCTPASITAQNMSKVAGAYSVQDLRKALNNLFSKMENGRSTTLSDDSKETDRSNPKKRTLHNEEDQHRTIPLSIHSDQLNHLLQQHSRFSLSSFGVCDIAELLQKHCSDICTCSFDTKREGPHFWISPITTSPTVSTETYLSYSKRHNPTNSDSLAIAQK